MIPRVSIKTPLAVMGWSVPPFFVVQRILTIEARATSFIELPTGMAEGRDGGVVAGGGGGVVFTEGTGIGFGLGAGGVEVSFTVVTVVVVPVDTELVEAFCGGGRSGVMRVITPRKILSVSFENALAIRSRRVMRG